MRIYIVLIVWLALLVGLKILFCRIDPGYRRDWQKWDRIKDPAGIVFWRNHTLKELIWWAVMLGSLPLAFTLMGA